MVRYARKRLRWTLIILGAVLAAALLTVSVRLPISSQRLRSRLIGTLEERLDAKVELGDLTLRLYPRLRATGENLTVRVANRADVPPLVTVARFRVEADLIGLWRRRVSRVVVDGLKIQVPPGRADSDDDAGAGRDSSDGERRAREEIVVSELVADAATLVILPRDPGKNPKTWQLHELHMKNVGFDQKMPFTSELTNAVPPGEIATTGSFGPWHVGDPGRTPLDGVFTFDRADLGVFKGIGGTLSAKGVFGGSLDRIEVHGETDTPDFTVTVSGQPVPLRTTYDAIVDGTNGNTTLERIDASFLDTSLLARGGVYDVKGVKGRLVTLDIDMQKARLEDIMRLSVKSPQPPMTGALRLATTFELPPGDVDVVDKLQLDGEFAIHGGRFTNPDVQRKIVELSRRASTGASRSPGAVTSEFNGRFRLQGGTLSLSRLVFDVPGAAVDLRGEYVLRKETLAFAGDLHMDAKVSQTTTGFKSALLKVVDPLFRKDGRTTIPIKIGGTRSAPQYGLDIKRVFTRDR
jgi:hypothetical protein